MKFQKRFAYALISAICFGELAVQPGVTLAQTKQPNIVVIMGDDIGWFNLGSYHQGVMAGKTPNLDKLASEGSGI